MRVNRSYILLFALLIASGLFAQDVDRLGERTIMGTARYVGMSGAMTAIGGDPSAVRDNPAGLGVYQRSEILVTGDVATDRTIQSGSVLPKRQTLLMIPQASWVLSLSNSMLDEGVIGHNIMLSYHRLQSFRRAFSAEGEKDASLGALLGNYGINFGFPYCADRYNNFQSLNIHESGYINEYSFDWGMNISHKWYVGVGLHLQSLLFTSEGDYYETFNRTNAEGDTLYIENESSLTMSGVSCTSSVGFIYRPCQWVRLGLAVHTPSLGSLTTYSSGTFSARTDSVRYSSAPELDDATYAFHLPFRMSASVAAQIGSIGLISLQYDYQRAIYRRSAIVAPPNQHTLKAGLELVPINGLYINAGYAYESTFARNDMLLGIDPTFDRQDAYFRAMQSSQYASFALGYRGHFMIAQVAYQYRWQSMRIYAHENAAPYGIHTDTHRVVLTLGWHRGI